MANTQNIIEALAVSVFAFEAAGQRVVRENGITNLTSNKIAIEEHFRSPKFTITDEHRVEAQRIRDLLAQHIVVTELSGKNVPSFLREVNELIQQEEIKQETEEQKPVDLISRTNELMDFSNIEGSTES